MNSVLVAGIFHQNYLLNEFSHRLTELIPFLVSLTSNFGSNLDLDIHQNALFAHPVSDLSPPIH